MGPRRRAVVDQPCRRVPNAESFRLRRHECGLGWVNLTTVRDHRFIPAITGGPPTLLQVDGARGPYRYSTWAGTWGCDGF